MSFLNIFIFKFVLCYYTNSPNFFDDTFVCVYVCMHVITDSLSISMALDGEIRGRSSEWLAELNFIRLCRKEIKCSLVVILSILEQENGEINPFAASPFRERSADSPNQLLAGRAREGSLEARYQQPFEDFRTSQEQLSEHFDNRDRR